VAEALGYWPWWAGAFGLAAAALTHLFLLRKPLGVSGAYARVIALKTELEAEREERAAFADAQLKASLVEETIADMRRSGVPEAEIEALAATSTPAPLVASRLPVTAQLVFLFSVLAGAFASAALSGRLTLQWAPGGLQPQLFGAGAGTVAALLGGGVLVGLGTRLAGGCTSGHGLSGCARIQPASLLATAIFFGAGVAASFALARVLS